MSAVKEALTRGRLQMAAWMDAHLPERLRTWLERLSVASGMGAPGAAGTVWGRRALILCVCFLVFFACNWYALRLPDLLRQSLERSGALRISYTKAEVDFFPPALTLRNAVCTGPLLRGAVLRFDELHAAPRFLPLLLGRLGLRLDVRDGNGTARLDVATGAWADFGRTVFSLDMRNLPLSAAAIMARFDPDAQGTITGSAQGDILWMQAGGQTIPRDCILDARGQMRLASVRNDVAALTFDRFRDGLFRFDIAVEGRMVSVRQMSFADQACSATISGKAVLDWRNVPDSELNLLAEVKARPSDVSPMLMNEALQQKLESGQALPFTLQGTLRNVQMKPVL